MFGIWFQAYCLDRSGLPQEDQGPKAQWVMRELNDDRVPSEH